MRIASLAVVVALVVGVPRTAHASGRGRCGDTCNVVFWVLGIGMLSGYGLAHAGFIYRDLTDDSQSAEYAGGELAYNALMGGLIGAGFVASVRSKNVKWSVITGGLTAMHATLAIHGGIGLWKARDEIGPIKWPSSDVLPYLGAMVYIANTLTWTSMLPREHSRNYGILELSVNAPITIGMGYLTYRSLSDDPGPKGVALGGLTLLSGAFAVHGLTKIIAPDEPKGMDLLRDVIPVVVTDGVNQGPGIGIAGSW